MCAAEPKCTKKKFYISSRKGKKIALSKIFAELSWLQNGFKPLPAFVSEIAGSDQGTTLLACAPQPSKTISINYNHFESEE